MTPRALPRRLPLEKQYLIPFELNFRINCTPLITPKREIKQNPSSFLPVGTYLFSERALFKVEPNENLWAKNKPRRRRFYFCAVLNFPDISLRWHRKYTWIISFAFSPWFTRVSFWEGDRPYPLYCWGEGEGDWRVGLCRCDVGETYETIPGKYTAPSNPISDFTSVLKTKKKAFTFAKLK